MADENQGRSESFPRKDAQEHVPEAIRDEDAPATGPLPLTPPDRPDMGCYIGLIGIFVGMLLVVAFLARIGAVVILALLAALLMLILTPFVNPAERMSEKAKWWGRAITFVVLCALLSGGFLYVWNRSNRAPEGETYER